MIFLLTQGITFRSFSTKNVGFNTPTLTDQRHTAQNGTYPEADEGCIILSKDRLTEWYGCPGSMTAKPLSEGPGDVEASQEQEGQRLKEAALKPPRCPGHLPTAAGTGTVGAMIPLALDTVTAAALAAGSPSPG